MPKSALARLFIGQLPYSITDEQLNFAIAVATGGIVLQHVERIVIWKKNRAPTGCVHAYCLPSEVDAVLLAHQRVLFDEDGVWVAQSEDEMHLLRNYVVAGAVPSKACGGCMPTNLLTVEKAKSTYVPDDRFRIKGFVGRRAMH